MRDYREQVDQLAGLMDEFNLEQASLNVAGFQIKFRRRPKQKVVAQPQVLQVAAGAESEAAVEAPLEAPEETPQGHAVSSPMAGIFYITSGPGSPAFVKIGDEVTLGQTVGLIEAMKVFNEIPSPFSGVVLDILVENGDVVQPGQALVRIG